jgi:hypothetical protein
LSIVALIYGDRDYIRNWLGGEAVSFAIVEAAGASYLPWYQAGYVPIVTNDSYIGGVVRRFGNVSFSRIYDAGHLIPAYQPETTFTVFSRIIQGTDIGMGSTVDLSSYGSAGDMNATYTNSVPQMEKPTCFLRFVNATCNQDQKNMLANHGAVITNGALYEERFEWNAPATNITLVTGGPSTASSSIVTWTSTSRVTKLTVDKSGNEHSIKTDQTRASGLPTGAFTATTVPLASGRSQKAKGGAALKARGPLSLSSMQPTLSLFIAAMFICYLGEPGFGFVKSWI